MKKECKDHLGNVYSNITDMCRFYGISRQIFLDRLNKNWDLERALTTPTRSVSKKIIVKGVEYSSIKDFSQKTGIKESTIYCLRSRGLSIEEIFEEHNQPHKKAIEFNYNNKHYSFESIAEAARYFNISSARVRDRLKLGWDIVDAFTIPVYKNGGNPRICYDHLNNRYLQFKDMCEAYGLNHRMVGSRLKNGWSLEEALTIPRNMYIGEYRVAECLKRLNVTFYYDCSLRKIFEDLNVNIDWNTFLSELKSKLEISGIKWSKSKIEKLRPDFTLYTSDNNKIIGVIEFDGEQHQNFVEFFFKTVEEFLRRSNADFIKQGLWEYLNIPMLRIRYDQVNMIDDMVMDLLNNPEKYLINHNTYLSEDEYWEPLRETKESLDIAFAA